MDNQFHPTPYLACGYLSMLGRKLIHVNKVAPVVVVIVFTRVLSVQCLNCDTVCHKKQNAKFVV